MQERPQASTRRAKVRGLERPVDQGGSSSARQAGRGGVPPAQSGAWHQDGR
jgi:hypothetical protein